MLVFILLIGKSCSEIILAENVVPEVFFDRILKFFNTRSA